MIPIFSGHSLSSYISIFEKETTELNDKQKCQLFLENCLPHIRKLTRHDEALKANDWNRFIASLFLTFPPSDSQSFIIQNHRKYYVSPGALYAMARQYKDNDSAELFCSRYVQKLISFSKAFYMYGLKLYETDELTWSDIILLFLGSFPDYIRLALLEGDAKSGSDIHNVCSYLNRRKKISTEQASDWFGRIEKTFKTAYRYSLKLIDATISEVPHDQYEILASSWRRHSKSESFDINKFYDTWALVTNAAIEKKQISVEYGYLTLIKCLPQRFGEYVLFLVAAEFSGDGYFLRHLTVKESEIDKFEDIITIIKKYHDSSVFQHYVEWSVKNMYISTGMLGESIKKVDQRNKPLPRKIDTSVSFVINCPLVPKDSYIFPPPRGVTYNSACSHTKEEPLLQSPFLLCENFESFDGVPNPQYNNHFSKDFGPLADDDLAEFKSCLYILLDPGESFQGDEKYQMKFILDRWQHITSLLIRKRYMEPNEQYLLALGLLPDKLRETFLSSFHPQFIFALHQRHHLILGDNHVPLEDMANFFIRLGGALSNNDVQSARLNQVVQKFELIWWKEGSCKNISSSEWSEPKVPNPRRVQLRCKFCDEYSHQIKDCPRYKEFSDAYDITIVNQGRPNEYIEFSKTLQQFKPPNPGEGGIMRSNMFIQFAKNEEDIVNSMDVY